MDLFLIVIGWIPAAVTMMLVTAVGTYAGAQWFRHTYAGRIKKVIKG